MPADISLPTNRLRAGLHEMFWHPGLQTGRLIVTELLVECAGALELHLKHGNTMLQG